MYEGVPEDVPGVLIRADDGTLYFIPDDDLEECYTLPEGEQPGSKAGDRTQDQLNHCPPLHKLGNALRTRRADIGIIERLTPGEGVFKPKIKTDSLKKLKEETESSHSRGRLFRPVESGRDEYTGDPEEGRGILIRADDGTLYFVPDSDLESPEKTYKLPEHEQPRSKGGVESQQELDGCPPVYKLKNALRTSKSGLDAIENLSPGGAFKPKIGINPLKSFARSTPRGRSTRAYSRGDMAGDHGFDSE